MLDGPSVEAITTGFASLHQLGVEIREFDGSPVVAQASPAEGFLGYLAGFPCGEACRRSAERGSSGPLAPGDGARPALAPGVPGALAVDWLCGLRTVLWPIARENEVLGRVVLGPFVPSHLKELPGLFVSGAGDRFDSGHARELLERIPRLSEAEAVRVLRHLADIVEALLLAGTKTHLAERVHEASTRASFREIEAKNRELQETNAQLREVDRLKSNFLATVSHELRTPLTAILGCSELLVKGMAGPLGPEQEELARTILEKGEGLRSLITAILDITQIDAGRVRFSFAPVDLNALVREAVDGILPHAKRKHVAIEARLAAESPFPSLDAEKVRQCLSTLLGNSVKFTPPEGRIQVTVLSAAPRGLLPAGVEGPAVVIEDTGIGIPSDELEHIFGRFYQVDQSSTRRHGGAGLGLTIAKHFVEAHGGRIHVASEVGKFSRFTLALPHSPRSKATGDALL
jgi:signal transduction histidine kinase